METELLSGETRAKTHRHRMNTRAVIRQSTAASDQAFNNPHYITSEPVSQNPSSILRTVYNLKSDCSQAILSLDPRCLSPITAPGIATETHRQSRLPRKQSVANGPPNHAHLSVS